VKTVSRIALALLISLLVSSTFAFLVRAPAPLAAGILLTKTPSATKVLSGTSVSYLYNATNTGETDLTGAIYDDVFGEVGYFVDLAPGGWVGFNVTHVITQNTTNVATAYGVDQYGQNVTDSDSVFVEVYYLNPAIESCDSLGTVEDSFGLMEDVYVVGSGFAPSTTYDLYVVLDEAVWSDGMVIPARVSGSATSVSSDFAGNIPVTLAWASPLVPGKYDIVVDVNGNGVYDAGVDALDDGDIEVTAGFFVIPEVPMGTLMASTALIIGFVCYFGFPKIRRKKENVKP
jgi:hypothetical protein